MRLTLDKQTEYARELLVQLAGILGQPLVDEMLAANQTNEAGIQSQRARLK